MENILIVLVCVLHLVKAGVVPIVDPAYEIVLEEPGYGAPVGGYADLGYPNVGYPSGWGAPAGWALANSQVLTGGSASAGKNTLAGGSTSADNGVFTKTKTHSRTRGSSSVGFGMIGGDGGDNNNVQKGGIEYNGGGITNFLSKVQGINNQGVNGANDLWNYLRVHQPYPAGSYGPMPQYAPEGPEPGSYEPGFEPVDPLVFA